MPESASILMSAFYAKFLIILGIAFPVTNAIIGASPRKIDAFYIYLNLVSTIFLAYFYIMYLIGKKTRRLQKNNSKTFLNDNNQIRHGSFYLHLGVAAFGMISVIYSSLQFGQYFELTSKCTDPLIAFLPFTKVVFMIQQMIFIFSWSQQIKKNKHLALRRFGIMHMIATNICTWARVIIEETKFDIFNATQKRIIANTLLDKRNSSLNEISEIEERNIKANLSLEFYKFSWEYDDSSPDCYSSNIMKPLLRNANPYLSPCAVEYSLLCTVILVIMWKNICTNIDMKQQKSIVEKQKHVVVDYNEPINKFYFDCSNAQKGLFLATMFLSVTIISLIMFYELVKMPGYHDVAVFQVNIWEIILFTTSTIVAIICMVMIRKVAMHQIQKEFHSEHVLLFVTQAGVYTYSLFQIIGYYFLIVENTAESKFVRILSPTCSIIQSTIQTLLIIEAWRRHCNSNVHIKQKSARQTLTFLIMSNISLWIINRVKNNRAEFHPLQMEFYGVWAWTIITHIALPMVVCYRFQSTICFYQIWKNMNEESEVEKTIIKSIRIRK